MGNCPACLSGRYSMIHDMGSEEGDDQMGESGSSGGGIKVVRVTDGKVFEYKSTTASSSDDDDDPVHMQRLRAKDVILKLQEADEGSLLYELFDQSHTTMAKRKKKNNKNERSEEGGSYASKPLHPETLLEISRVYYLRPACVATTANYDQNILSNINRCPATTSSTTAAAIKAATSDEKTKNKKKKVRFSDHVVFIEPAAPSSNYNHHRQPDCVSTPAVQGASVLPNLAAAPLSELENHMARAQNINVLAHHDDDGVPIHAQPQLPAERPIVRVKLLLSKRQLCDLLAATGHYHQQQQSYHSQLAAADVDVLAEKLVAPHLPLASLSSLPLQQAHRYTMSVS